VEETIPRLLLSGSNFSNCQNAEIRLPGYLELSSTNSDIKKHGRCPGQNVIKLCRWLDGSIYDRLIRLLRFWQDPAQVERFVLTTIIRLGINFFQLKSSSLFKKHLHPCQIFALNDEAYSSGAPQVSYSLNLKLF